MPFIGGSVEACPGIVGEGGIPIGAGIAGAGGILKLGEAGIPFIGGRVDDWPGITGAGGVFSGCGIALGTTGEVLVDVGRGGVILAVAAAFPPDVFMTLS